MMDIILALMGIAVILLYPVVGLIKTIKDIYMNITKHCHAINDLLDRVKRLEEGND